MLRTQKASIHVLSGGCTQNFHELGGKFIAKHWIRYIYCFFSLLAFPTICIYSLRSLHSTLSFSILPCFSISACPLPCHFMQACNGGSKSITVKSFKVTFPLSSGTLVISPLGFLGVKEITPQLICESSLVRSYLNLL